MIYAVFGRYSIAFPFLIIIIFLLIELKKIKTTSFQELPLYPKFISTTILIGIITLLPIANHDDFSNFFKSAYYYHNFNNIHNIDYERGSYPLIKQKIKGSNISKRMIKKSDKILPNIFIIMIESFKGNFVDKRSPEGFEYTPNFNRLINEGVFIENFYANSIQTCRGHSAIFNSILPGFRGKVFKKYFTLKLKSLPEILRLNNYNTIFFQAYHNLDFDNTKIFLLSHGFSDVKTVYSFLSKKEKSEIVGWGPEDKLLYKHFFSYLDKNYKKSKKQVFASFATILNHMSFVQRQLKLSLNDNYNSHKTLPLKPKLTL